MDESQQDRFMGLRKQHLNKLRSIYQERQDLNMQVSNYLKVLRCITDKANSPPAACFALFSHAKRPPALCCRICGSFKH